MHDDNDDKNSNRDTYVQEFLQVENQSKIDNSRISKSTKPPSLIYLRRIGKRNKTYQIEYKKNKATEAVKNRQNEL